MRNIAQDITGKRFGKLVALENCANRCGNRTCLICLCDCGTYKHVSYSNLNRGDTRSCGCVLRISGIGQRTFKHGEIHSRAYSIWRSMKARCLRVTHKNYNRYGGRGIQVCERWLDFKNFLEDMGAPPIGMTLERTNNDGPYSPDNCRWATRIEQSNNTSTNTHLTYNGETLTLMEWARRFNVTRSSIRSRKRRGWSDETVLSYIANNKRC